MRKLAWFTLYALAFAWFGKDGQAQNPPAGAIGIGSTQVQGGISGRFLKVGSNGKLTQGTGGGGSGCVPGGSSGQILSDDGAGGCVSNTTAAGFLTFMGSPTSAHLATVVSDESGTGLLVFNTNATLVTPTIASFVNATHNHQAAAGGGTLAEAALALTNVTTNDVTTSAHGFAPKGTVGTTQFWRQDWTLGTPAGSSPISGATTNAIVTAASATTIQIPSATTTLDASGNAVFAGSVNAASLSTGGSPPTVTGTGVLAFGETTGQTCAAAAVDCIKADSTQHGLLSSFNNGSFLPLVQGPASQTTGRVASWNGTNGGLLADAGFLAANVVQASSPGVGICHFAGSTQSCTSSLIVNADITNGSIDLTTKVTGVTPVANGGSGAATLAAHGVVIGNGSSAVAVSGAGTSGECLTSNGASSDPTFQTCGVGAGVTTFTGDGALISNVASAGAVTTTLATAAAHKFWMNNTGSTAAPGYQSAALADLPSTVVNATTPGAGIAHFAGSTQTVTSSAVVNADITSLDASTKLTGATPVANGGTGLATLTAHALYAGNATTAPTAVGPDASTTKALFSAGSSADPAFRAIANADLPTLTYTPSVFGGAGLVPDSSGNVFMEPFTILSGSAFFAYNIMAFADTSTLDCAYTRFNVPINYTTGATTWIVDWNTTATSGNAIWTLDYRDVSTATLAATTSQESLTVTTAASGTASARTQSTMTATASNFTAGDIIQIRFCRNGAGSDTIAATLAIHDLRFSYVGRP